MYIYIYIYIYVCKHNQGSQNGRSNTRRKQTLGIEVLAGQNTLCHIQILQPLPMGLALIGHPGHPWALMRRALMGTGPSGPSWIH